MFCLSVCLAVCTISLYRSSKSLPLCPQEINQLCDNINLQLLNCYQNQHNFNIHIYIIYLFIFALRPAHSGHLHQLNKYTKKLKYSN